MATLSDSNEVWAKEIRDAHEKTGDLNLWERTQLLTISQMAALSWVGRRDKELSQMQEIVDHHRKLILRDCTNGTLNPIHPVTFIPYSSYLLSGAFEEETEIPIPNASWCIDYFQVEKWYFLHSKSVDLNYAREGLYENTLSVPPEKSPLGRANVSDKLAHMNQAAAKFWGNADRNDRGTHPENSTVTAWLVKQGFSQTLADKAATIIRPEWAPTGRRPEE